MGDRKIKVEAKKILLNGKEELSVVTEPVQAVERGIGNLRSIGSLSSIHADACVYCSSTDRLSSEHIIPYAWGGTLQIHLGSCERCRLITQNFENYAINGGAMPHVRKALGIQSRSKHKSAKVAPEVTLSGVDGDQIPVADDVATPIVLGFPLFLRPGLLSDDGGRSDLRLEGISAVVFGSDTAEFLQNHGAHSATQREDGKRVVALARTMAKIAYCFAWRDGVLEALGGATELVRAFMDDSHRLGAFVGTKQPPYERYQGCQLRIEYKLAMPEQRVYLEVQLFSDTGAPTYEVVLGQVDSVRQWRRMLKNLRS